MLKLTQIAINKLWDKQHQVSLGDNYNEWYLLTLIDSIWMTFSFGVLGMGYGVWLVVRSSLIINFSKTIWYCLLAHCDLSDCNYNIMMIIMDKSLCHTFE